jgi:hypothetical protein
LRLDIREEGDHLIEVRDLADDLFRLDIHCLRLGNGDTTESLYLPIVEP